MVTVGIYPFFIGMYVVVYHQMIDLVDHAVPVDTVVVWSCTNSIVPFVWHTQNYNIRAIRMVIQVQIASCSCSIL